MPSVHPADALWLCAGTAGWWNAAPRVAHNIQIDRKIEHCILYVRFYEHYLMSRKLDS
jgi:hypothetical protein